MYSLVFYPICSCTEEEAAHRGSVHCIKHPIKPESEVFCGRHDRSRKPEVSAASVRGETEGRAGGKERGKGRKRRL